MTDIPLTGPEDHPVLFGTSSVARRRPGAETMQGAMFIKGLASDEEVILARLDVIREAMSAVREAVGAEGETRVDLVVDMLDDVTQLVRGLALGFHRRSDKAPAADGQGLQAAADRLAARQLLEKVGQLQQALDSRVIIEQAPKVS